MTDTVTDLPSDTLATAIATARMADPALTLPGGKTGVFVPNGFQFQTYDDPAMLPPRAVAVVTVDDRASLVAYVNRFSSDASILMADVDRNAVTATLDYHPANDAETAGGAGAVKHKVTLQLRQSEEFKRWDGFEGDFHPQTEFAAFLEENSVDITMPEAAVMVEISRDLEATTEQKFSGRVRLENGDLKMSFETETKTPTAVVIPKEIVLSIPIYQGEQPELLRAAFRYRATPDGLKMAITWRRVEYQRLAHFAEIATAASEATGCPLFYGRPA